MFTLPNGKDYWVNYDFSVHLHECLGPLPRTREIDELEAYHAMEQQRKRDRLAKHLSIVFTNAVLKVLEKQDPVNGYDPTS
jgi:hypothetical protein